MDEHVDETGMDLSGVESRLRESLQHVPAPVGFTDRVMARVAERENSRVQRAKSSRSLATMHRKAGWWSAVAAALLLSVGGGALFQHHEREQRAAEMQAQEAQAQLDLALQLTNHALDQVQGGIDRSPAGQILNELSK